MRLAVALGKTLGELNWWLDRHPDEWKLWCAYNRIEPIPEPYLQTGLVCSTFANVMGCKTTPEDFMPVVKKTKKQSHRQVKANMHAWAKAHNAQVEKEEKNGVISKRKR